MSQNLFATLGEPAIKNIIDEFKTINVYRFYQGELIWKQKDPKTWIELGANLIYVDATERFLTRLEGVAEPEKKRKIIGDEFIQVFSEEAKKLDGIEFLAQGTIYLILLKCMMVKI